MRDNGSGTAGSGPPDLHANAWGIMSKYTLRVNGQPRSVDVTPETPMLWVLRDALGLVGTKYGCGIGECGACTIHLNGNPTRACQTEVSSVGNAAITTIEGV